MERLHQFEVLGAKMPGKTGFRVCIADRRSCSVCPGAPTLDLLDAGTAGTALAYLRAAHALSEPTTRVAFSAWECQNIIGADQKQCGSFLARYRWQSCNISSQVSATRRSTTQDRSGLRRGGEEQRAVCRYDGCPVGAQPLTETSFRSGCSR